MFSLVLTGTGALPGQLIVLVPAWAMLRVLQLQCRILMNVLPVMPGAWLLHQPILKNALVLGWLMLLTSVSAGHGLSGTGNSLALRTALIRSMH
jgi:hypothetical protein